MPKRKVANPEMAHLKDLMRTISIFYESLGLSFKSTPSKMKESTKVGVDDEDPIVQLFKSMKDM